MTTTLAPPPSAPPTPARRRSRAAGRRAIRRWAWRLLRREWRQQLLVLSLIAFAVAATTAALGVVVNVQSSDEALLGTAASRIDIGQPGSHVSADIAIARQALGTLEVIEHDTVPVPGSVTPVDLRAQDPHGTFGAVMLRVVSGSYPAAGQIAVTSAVAKTFNLDIGSRWTVDGRALRVVGLVENPKDLQDQFALVAPGQIRSPSGLTVLTDAGGSAATRLHLPGGSFQGIITTQSEAKRQRIQALAVLLIATIGLTFIGLLAVAGFTVMAHRRQRALGMIGAVGATDRQVRRVMLANGAAVGAVGASVGLVTGLVVWFALRRAFEHLVGHRIDPMSIPWWAIIAGAGLAVLTALAASWWPARSVARMPIVAALSGRPTPPRPAHRFALSGLALAAGGFVLLVFAGEHHTAPFIISGILATTVGMLLLAPLSIRALAATARRAPVAVRLAIRDLARFQARSGAALAAAGLAVGIAATIAITAAAEQAADHSLSGGNLPTNQLIVWLAGNPNEAGPSNTNVVAVGNGGGASGGPSQAAIANARETADSISQALHARHELQLDVAADPSGNAPAGAPPGANDAILLRPITEHGQHGWTLVTTPLVATSAVLDFYGIPRAQALSSADILSARADLSGSQLGTGWKGAVSTATVHVLTRLPNYTSAPNTLVTEKAMTAHGLTRQPAGWLLQTARPLTSAQITHARHLAASAGITIETRTSSDDSLQKLREYATIVGLLVALGVLAMTVGLIRSETANDLRTLAATGASSNTRRTLTAATAAALAVLGGLLGTAGAYLALVAWHWHDVSYLDQPPYLELATLVLGLPVAALMGGWLLGRTPTAIARNPLD